MPRDPEGDCFESAGDLVGNPRRLRKYEREGAGPQRLGEPPSGFGNHGGPMRHRLTVRHVNDQGMIDRAPFRRKDPAHRHGVRSQRSETVNRLGREDHEVAVDQRLSCISHRIGR